MPRVEEFNTEVVLKKAMDLFWEKGYNGTSMQDLVDVTGLNRSSIYNSFDSKKELYRQTLLFYHNQTAGVFQKSLVKATNPLHAIRLIFEGCQTEILDDNLQKGCFIMNCKSEMSNQDSNIREWLLETQDGNLAMFQDLVEDGQEQGIISKKESKEHYAYYLLSAFQGLRMTGILVKDRKVLQHIIDQTIKVLE